MIQQDCRARAAGLLSWQEAGPGNTVAEKGQTDSQRSLRRVVSFGQRDRLKHRGGDAANATCSSAQRAIIMPKKVMVKLKMVIWL